MRLTVLTLGLLMAICAAAPSGYHHHHKPPCHPKYKTIYETIYDYKCHIHYDTKCHIEGSLTHDV